MILLIDNYDSFVHNLARYFELAGCYTQVFRNDGISLSQISRLKPKAIVISPGPCTPNEAGISLQAIRRFAGEIPIFGVCLGHQAIASAFGGVITNAKKPMHGSAARIHHDGESIFQNLQNPLKVGRYHSLVIEPQSLPRNLSVSASSEEGEIMAIRHKTLPIVGVQFHPESILTDDGQQLIENYVSGLQ